jgi:hypothetical protein
MGPSPPTPLPLRQERGFPDYAHLRDTPVIALTRFIDNERIRQAGFAGFISVLNMNLFEDQLRRAMRGEFVEGP